MVLLRRGSVTLHTYPALPAPRLPKAVDQATVSHHQRATDQAGNFLGTLIALRHSCIPFLSSYALPKSGLTLEASYVVSPVITSGPVRLPLQPSPDHLYITLSLSGYPPRRRRRLRGSQILPLFLVHSMPTPLPRGSLQVYVPVASLQAMAFAQTVGARRVRRHIGDDIPVIRLSQLWLPDTCISGLQRSLSCYGLLIWLAPRTG